jgi:hypothetical protein
MCTSEDSLETAAPADADNQLSGLHAPGKLDERGGGPFGHNLVVGAAERFDEGTLRSQGSGIGRGEPVGCGDVDGE